MTIITFLAALVFLGDDPTTKALDVRVPIDLSGEFDLADLVSRVEKVAGVAVEHRARLEGSRAGRWASALSHLSAALGQNVSLEVRDAELILTIKPEELKLLKSPLERLAEATRSGHALGAGFRALDSYRPNDLDRPTICLVHGLNSSSRSFVYLIPALEREGFGIVVHEYFFNRDLDTTANEFTRDWKAFRALKGEKLPWAIITHSMGTLLARWYIEGDAYDDDVCDLIMIAPPNQGAAIATAQTVIELIDRFRAGRKDSRALSRLGEGLGEAAVDITPGSSFLRKLNARPRRAGVRYHILAGDRGFLDQAGRKRIEARIAFLKRTGGVLGGVTNLMEGNLGAVLDETTDDTGDGCVSVAFDQDRRRRGSCRHSFEPRLLDSRTDALLQRRSDRLPLVRPRSAPTASACDQREKMRARNRSRDLGTSNVSCNLFDHRENRNARIVEDTTRRGHAQRCRASRIRTPRRSRNRPKRRVIRSACISSSPPRCGSATASTPPRRS